MAGLGDGLEAEGIAIRILVIVQHRDIHRLPLNRAGHVIGGDRRAVGRGHRDAHRGYRRLTTIRHRIGHGIAADEVAVRGIGQGGPTIDHAAIAGLSHRHDRQGIAIRILIVRQGV